MSKKIDINKLKEKYKVGKNKIHSNNIWVGVLRDCILSISIALLLIFTLGFEFVFFGEIQVFFKISILMPFLITLFQFFSPQRLVFFESEIMIKRPFKKSVFINYKDVKFASILEEKTGRESLQNREVLIIVHTKSNLVWNENLANTKAFNKALKNNSAISCCISKRLLLDFIFRYEKNFYNLETFIKYRYKFDCLKDLAYEKDISIIEAEKAENMRIKQKTIKRKEEYNKASANRKKELHDEDRYYELITRDIEIDEEGKIKEYSKEEERFIKTYKKNAAKKIIFLIGISISLIFLIFILPAILLDII